MFYRRKSELDKKVMYYENFVCSVRNQVIEVYNIQKQKLQILQFYAKSDVLKGLKKALMKEKFSNFIKKKFFCNTENFNKSSFFYLISITCLRIKFWLKALLRILEALLILFQKSVIFKYLGLISILVMLAFEGIL